MGIISRIIIYDEALVTSLIKYAEKDCIARLFFRDHGRVNGFYRRGRALSKTNASVIQAPCFARVGFVRSKTDGQLVKIRSCDLDPMFVKSVSLKQMGYCFYISELVEKFIPEGEVEPELFLLTKQIFKLIYTCGAKPSLLRAFELKLLFICGFLAEIPENNSNQELFYDPLLFVFKQKQDNKFDILITPKILRYFREFLVINLEHVSCDDLEVLLVLGKIFQSRLRALFKKPLNSILFLKSIQK